MRGAAGVQQFAGEPGRLPQTSTFLHTQTEPAQLIYQLKLPHRAALVCVCVCVCVRESVFGEVILSSVLRL